MAMVAGDEQAYQASVTTDVAQAWQEPWRLRGRAPGLPGRLDPGAVEHTERVEYETAKHVQALVLVRLAASPNGSRSRATKPATGAGPIRGSDNEVHHGAHGGHGENHDYRKERPYEIL